MAIKVSPESAAKSEVAVKVVDCDVHPTFAVDRFAELIPEPWRSRYFRKPLPMGGGLYGSVMS